MAKGEKQKKSWLRAEAYQGGTGHKGNEGTQRRATPITRVSNTLTHKNTQTHTLTLSASQQGRGGRSTAHRKESPTPPHRSTTFGLQLLREQEKYI